MAMKFWTPAVKVGLMVVIAIVLLAILLINAGNWPWGTRGDDIYFRFRAANGLYVGSGVYLSGVSIGRVTGIELKPETNTVEIRASVKNAFQWLKKGCVARISMSGFVGETYIALNNGDVGNPPLQPSDLPIIGIDPVNPLELLEQTSSGLSQAIELTTAANEVLQESQKEIQQVLKEARTLVVLTGKTLEKFNKNMDITVDTLTDLAKGFDTRFKDTLLKTNRVLEQLSTESMILSSQINDISRSVLRVIDQNSPKINNILTDLQRSTSDFQGLASQFRQDSSSLKTEISGLITQGSNFIEKGSTDIAPIIKNLQTVTASLTTLEKNITELLNTIKHGEGTVAQLLNNPEPFAEAKQTLNNMNEMFTGLKDFYQQTDKQLKGFKLPKYSWDAELQYLSLEENLHTEFGFSLLPSPPSKNLYHFGLSIREEKIGVDFRYAYNFTNYLRGRLGFTRSKVGAGFELWLLSRRLGIGVESIGLTQDRPELNAELSFRFFRGGHVLVSVENWWSDERRWTTGLKLITNNW